MSTVARPSSEERSTASVIRLVQALLLVESSMYSAVTPLLPHYARALHASKPSLGVLAAAYAGGLVPGSLLGGWLAIRIGIRRTTLIGVLAFALAVIAFGLASDLSSLIDLRIAQGVACGCIWGGALTWVIAIAPAPRRGAAVGAAISAAVLGTLAGPLLGTAALVLGTLPAFGAVGAVSFALAVAVARHMEPPRQEPGGFNGLPALLRRRTALLGVWLTTLEALAFGAINVLIPLRLAQFGASGVTVGATFLAAAAVSALVASWIGRLCDRLGVVGPVITALFVGALLMALLPVPDAAVMLAVFTVVLAGGPLSAFLTPSVTLLATSAEAVGTALAVSTMLFNLAFAVGETIGAPAAASLAQATSDAVPFVALALLLLGTIPFVLAIRRESSPVSPHPAVEQPDPG